MPVAVSSSHSASAFETRTQTDKLKVTK